MTITRKQYMENSSELFHAYYMQFVTESTKHFIVNSVGMAKIRKSKDGHLNDVAKISRGGAETWVWDSSPVNIDLMRKLGEVSERGLPSQSAHTCVGKACARDLLNKEKVTA